MGEEKPTHPRVREASHVHVAAEGDHGPVGLGVLPVSQHLRHRLLLAANEKKQ